MNQHVQHTARVRVGIGGWSHKPWRDNFYPKSWPPARELEYASRRLSMIEINNTLLQLAKAGDLRALGR